MSGRLPGLVAGCVSVAAAVAGWGCGRAASVPNSKRIIVLGIDGMDPGFLERHWSRLPHLDRLRRAGDFRRLGTTTPPQSPVAWSTFITGMDPGGHGIFDFVHRDPATMTPFSSMGETVESKRRLPLGPYSLPLAGGEVLSFRQGKAFWQFLSERGIPATILRMPTNFPPVPCQCQQLAGMGTPDMQGTYGTFTFYTDDPAEAPRQVAGGKIVRVTVTENRALLPLEGPVNSLRKDRRRTSASLVVYRDPGGRAARFDLDGNRIILREGEWSDWTRVQFPLIPGIQSASGIVRIFAQQLSPNLRIYVSPVNIDPASPDVPISVPASYSRELAQAIGPFYTQGIAEDTAALRQGVFRLKDYLDQSRIVAQEQLALLRLGIERFRGGLFFQHFLGVDQNSHMLWGKYENELLETYRMVDDAVGWVRERAGDATLIVMSDHGFAAFDRAVHLNTWLLREGFLTLDDPANTGPDELFAHVDWSRTQAYALGLNGLYLNLEGRERHGIVRPGAQAELILRVISRRLRDFRDPVGGSQVIANVYSPREVFNGNALALAPDLIVGYNAPYRCSWQSALGATPAETIEDNRDAWIGDHCNDAGHVPGVLIANRPVRLADPRLADLTATILSEYGVPRPEAMGGRSIF
ncbi:MAG: alkaline phosphatase family protein [Bryobacterales bacterium]|nr:alkaline phosphatase family protein [Bryobacterales bacterium]